MGDRSPIAHVRHFQPLVLVRGESWDRYEAVFDPSGEPVSLSGARVVMWIKEDTSGEVLVAKDSLLDEVDVGSVGYTLHADARDTWALNEIGHHMQTEIWLPSQPGRPFAHVIPLKSGRPNLSISPSNSPQDATMAAAAVPFLRYLEHATHGREMNKAGSEGSPIHFDLVPAAGEALSVKALRLLLRVSDPSSIVEFGNIEALANGIHLKAYRTVAGAADTEIADFFGGYAGQSNLDLATVGEVDFGNGIDGTYALGFRLDLRPDKLRLLAADGGYLRLSVRDDLTGLTSMRMAALCTDENVLA